MPPTPADLFLSPDLTEEDAQRYLQARGFRDPAGADRHLQLMAEDPVVRETLGHMAAELIDALLEAPSPDNALVGLARYLSARTARAMFLEYLHDDPRALHVMTHILGASPFLSEILIRDPEHFHWLISQIERSAPDLRDQEEEIEGLLAHVQGPVEVLDALKRVKRREMLRIAARDLIGRENVRSATAQLSDLASLLIDRALGAVTGQILEVERRRHAPGRFAVIGMGKLGGRELNYSSDIDLIYTYEPDDEDDSDAHEYFQRVGRKLTAALSEHTGEGYLYRVDLRLRPMGRAGNVAYSVAQHEQYYSAWGETFERFALIKARPVAGDPDVGRRFVEMVQPFVYRKYLDHAALEEMSRYKARTDRAVQGPEPERNVKVGRGGIREVELFTQVLQLTYGGGQERLRPPNTLDALDALHEAGLIAEDVREQLASAYVFLRDVEHRLQLVQESQTHSLSGEPDELEITARRLGFTAWAVLDAELESHRSRVNAIYRDLFEHRKGTHQFEGRQFFRMLSGEMPEAEAIAHLESYRLPDPPGVLAAIRSLGAAASLTQSPSGARNVLANLLAVAMRGVAEAARPARVLNRLEQLAARTGASGLLFRTLLEHEGLRDIVLQVLDAGELMSQRLMRYPELLDSLLLSPTGTEALARTAASALDRGEGLDRRERMSLVRRFKILEEFKILFEWLGGGTIETLQEKLSALADVVVQRAAAWHANGSLGDRVLDRPWAIVALGKLGGVELTVHSDLDLVVLYDGDPEDSGTFERYQAFVAALHAFLEDPAGEGVAYRIDTRLRPEGSKGALAIPFQMFQRYLDTRAEIWERLAWTRCRVLAASDVIADRIRSDVAAFVYGPWEARIPGYVADLRVRMERELAHETGQRLDFKVGKGGLADIDFALQLIQIREGAKRPEFRVTGTRQLLAALPANPYLSQEETASLREAHRFLRSLEVVARMESDSNVSWITPDPDLAAPLGVRLGFKDAPGQRLLETYRDVTSEVRKIYTAVVERLGT